MPTPTWHNEPVNPSEYPHAMREASEVALSAMSGPALPSLNTVELLHILEAASWLDYLRVWATEAVFPIARESGASWAQLAAAMGESRSTVKSRYERQYSTPNEAKPAVRNISTQLRVRRNGENAWTVTIGAGNRIDLDDTGIRSLILDMNTHMAKFPMPNDPTRMELHGIIFERADNGPTLGDVCWIAALNDQTAAVTIGQMARLFDRIDREIGIDADPNKFRRS